MPPPDPAGPKPPVHGPVVIPSANTVALGTQIVIAGQEFTPRGSVTILLEHPGGSLDTIAEEVAIDRDGHFAVPFDASGSLSPGEYNIVATSGGVEVRAPLRLTLARGAAEVDVAAAKPGDKLNVSATGFAPGEDVQILLDSLVATPLYTATADGGGAISVRGLRMPFAAEGDHLLLFLGVKSRAVVRAQISAIGFYPWVNLSSYASQPEVTLDFDGHSFAPHETVWVFMDDWGPSAFQQAITDAAGDFLLKSAYTVPPDLKGEHKFLFLGATSQKRAEATFSVLPYTPSIQLTVWAGKAGTKLAVSGKGFASGEKVNVYWGPPEDNILLSSLQAGADGSFLPGTEFAVPFNADIMKGGANITVVGQTSQAQASGWFELLTLSPSAELSQYEGPTGVTLQFSGNGFALGEDVVVSLTGSSQILATAKTDEKGSFKSTSTYTVPAGQSGVLEFVFFGVQSGAKATTHYNIVAPDTKPANPSGSPSPAPTVSPATPEPG